MFAIGKRATYVQAIPVYLPADDAVSKYMADNISEINAITGPYIQILQTPEVMTGDADAITKAIDADPPPYPGLKINDLPCLYLQDDIGNREVVQLPATIDSARRAMRELAQASRTTRNARVIAGKIEEKLMTKSNERKLALTFGVIFVAAILAIALFFPEPTDFQYTVFRIVLALAAAGFVSMTPGFLEARVGNFVRGGGALAAFVIVYFFAPAALPG